MVFLIHPISSVRITQILPFYNTLLTLEIVDVVDSETGTRLPWTLTDPVVGNHWRALAKGHRVLCFPIWLYCDDTSGNLSKKWNEHNSFLFTPAGLPRSECQKEFNIHFLATSNIAPPLEMLDGIVEQLRYAQILHHLSLLYKLVLQ